MPILMILFMVWVSFLIPCIGLGFIPASIARTKGYDYFGLWWLYGWLLFVVAMIHTLLLKDKRKEQTKCEICGTFMSNSANFCDHCGNSMAAHKLPKNCPNCGALLRVGQMCCNDCGNKIFK